MNKIPNELKLMIYSYLDDERDVGNTEIAFGLYDYEDMSTMQYEGQQSFKITTQTNKIAYYSKENNYASDGICYVKPLMKPLSAIMKFGFVISRDDILSCFIEFGLHRIPKRFKYQSQSTWFEYDYVGHIDIMGDGIQFWCHHEPSGRDVPLTPQTIKFMNTIDWRVMGTFMWYGAWSTKAKQSIKTGNFSLIDLLNYQESVPGFHFPPYQVIQSSGKGAPDSSVTLQDGFIRIACEGVIVDYDLDTKDLSKIPHDYVANKLRSTTDKKLSVLGVTGEEASLSPDEIDVDQKKVLELATNRSENSKSMINDFEGKSIKYNYILEPIECNVYYLIVGYTCVVTNLTLEQRTVDDLCSRFKAGLLMMSRVSEIVGYDVSGSVSSEDMKIGKAILSEMNNFEGIKSSDKYPLDILLTMNQDPTEADNQHVQNLIKTSLDKSRVHIPTDRKVLENYLNKFTLSECQIHSKRVTNIPMIYNNSNTDSNLSVDYWNSDMPSHLKKLWAESAVVKKEVDNIEEVIKEARSNITPEVRHAIKKGSIFKPDLSDNDKLELAKSGVGAKYLSSTETIITKEAKSKLSFSPLTDTSDIDMFIRKRTLQQSSKRFNPTILKAVTEMKRKSTNDTQQLSIDIWKCLIKTNLIGFFDQVTEIFQELSYNYKHWTVGNQFLLKTTNSGVKMIIKNTGSHLFVCFAYPKDNIEYIDTGRIGPKLFSSNNYVFTDFCSYNEPTLEHFMKSGPYMCSVLIHLISRSESEPTEITDHVNDEFNMISLLFLNNKTDSEEIMTSQRYLFMKLFEDATQDPYVFTDRLPDVLRSRLSVFLLQRCISLMDYYKENRIVKVPKVANNIIDYKYLNIKSIVNMQDITIENKINEFYFGYVVSKERGRGSDRNFKIIKKILQEEYKFRDSVSKVFVTMNDKIETYCTDPQLLKVFLHLFRSIMRDKIGNDYEETITNDYLSNLSFTNFTQIATLKASARDHSKLINVPENTEQDRSKLLRSLNQRNKEESSKRPKVLEMLIKITKEYQEETNKPIRHMMQLIPWCLKKLRAKGYFDSDIFPKPQHGGDREIHVLEMMSRIVQYSLELVSRTICKYFVSETITHPETKQNFVKKHYAETASAFKNSFVMSKSADASKWCQRHHVSHFAALFIGVAPKILHGFILKTLELWLHKKISFPLQLTATLLANRNTYTTNETFVRFRDEFYSGTGVFQQAMSNKIEVTSGMMQGILHYTSTLYHTMIQEVCKLMTLRIAKMRYNMNVVCTVLQGSDDSGMLLGIEGLISKEKVANAYALLRFKEELSSYLSVYWNVCKSSIGTIDLIEYNSEWHLRHKVIKPTFRWISAALEVSVRERFIDGYRMFNQLLTDCLEGGSTTLEVSVIQLNQVWMHCLLLGINTSSLGDMYVDNILNLGDPSLGFFPCDFDLSCGMPGVDFQLYSLCRNNVHIINKVDDDTSIQYDFEGSDRRLVPKDLRSVKLKFGKTHIWKSLVDRLNMGTLEWAIQEVENDPRILFGRHTSWDEEKPNLILKVFAPGVKESINNVSSTLRMMAAGAYVLVRPCLSIYESDVLIKVSLFSIVETKMQSRKTHNKLTTLKSCFPLHAEYEEFYKNIMSITKDHTTFSQQLSRHSKERVIVFEVSKVRHSIMDLCKRKWNLGGKVALSSRQFEHEWERTKLRFPFLCDTISLTSSGLSMTIVELKNFIESLELKARSVTLYDSPIKHGGIMSAITRLYWPNTKIRSPFENINSEMLTLRSDLFSVLTHWSTEIVTSRVVQDLISSCRSLRTDFKNVPNKYKKLKTIFDWSQNKSKMELVNQIIEHKQGTLGYFTREQTFVNGKRSGKGTWIGQVLGIPCRVDLRDEFVEKIEIKYLTDSLQLGYALSLLISEFRSEFNGQFYSSDLWLSKSGKFITKRHNNGEYIPTWINPNLVVDIITDIETKPWKLETGGTTIRLKLLESSGSRISYTILSETLSQKDWIETESSKLRDRFLKFWAQSTPINVSDLDQALSGSLPDDEKSFNYMCRNLYKTTTLSEWNIGKFRERLMSIFISPSDHTNDIYNQLPEEDSSLQTMEELNNLMNFISTGFSEQEFSNLSWADQVEFDLIDEDHSYMNNWGDMTEDVMDSIRSFTKDFENAYESPDQEQVDSNRWRKMSQSNKFFNNLSQLSLVQTGKTISENYNEAKGDPLYKCQGFFGKIISLMLLRLVVEGHDSNLELADIASESSRQVNSIMDEASLNELDYSNIMATVEQLNNVKQHLTGTAAVEMQKTIDKYTRLLHLKSSPTRTSDLEDISYARFMQSVINFLFEHKKTKYSLHNVEGNLRLSLIKIELIEFRENQLIKNDISNHEFTIFREHLNKNMCSNYLIDSLAECYSLNIDLGIYNVIINDQYDTFKF